MKDFIRFRKITPPEVPPTGCVDLAYDNDAGNFVARMADGTTQTIGSGSDLETSEGGNGVADAGKAAIYNWGGVLRGTAVVAGGNIGDLGVDYCVVLAKGVGPFSSSLTLSKAGSNSGLLRADDVTGSRILQFPDISGRIAVSSTISYADDTAAQAAGLEVGDLYFTGTKFRVRMS